MYVVQCQYCKVIPTTVYMHAVHRQDLIDNYQYTVQCTYVIAHYSIWVHFCELMYKIHWVQYTVCALCSVVTVYLYSCLQYEEHTVYVIKHQKFRLWSDHAKAHNQNLSSQPTVLYVCSLHNQNISSYLLLCTACTCTVKCK